MYHDLFCPTISADLTDVTSRVRVQSVYFPSILQAAMRRYVDGIYMKGKHHACMGSIMVTLRPCILMIHLAFAVEVRITRRRRITTIRLANGQVSTCWILIWRRIRHIEKW